MEGLLHQYEKLQEVYDTMKRLNFDYYFVDIENIDTKNILLNTNADLLMQILTSKTTFIL